MRTGLRACAGATWLPRRRVDVTSCRRGRALVAAAFGEHGQLLVGGFLLFQRFLEQRQRIAVTELLGQGAQGGIAIAFDQVAGSVVCNGDTLLQLE